GGTVRRAAREHVKAVRKRHGPADGITEIGRVGISRLTHNEGNIVVLTVGIVRIARRSVERWGQCYGCVDPVCSQTGPPRSKACSVVRLTPSKGQVAIS